MKWSKNYVMRGRDFFFPPRLNRVLSDVVNNVLKASEVGITITGGHPNHTESHRILGVGRDL